MEIMKLPLNIYRITWKQLYNKHTEIYSLMIDGLFHVKFVWNLVGQIISKLDNGLWIP
jgi:hypothetical protein